MSNRFNMNAPFEAAGDQPNAISSLVNGVRADLKSQVLLGATGTGKTFTIAKVINECGKPTLVLAHNKTLAAQLFAELKQLFPENAVEYFVSYYDYYQPEAYVPSSDNYIPKDSQINERIDKLRHAATRSLLERRDVIIVSSVSCIYGIGSREAYDGMLIQLEEGMIVERDIIITKLVEIFYLRNDVDFHRGTFRVRGDVIDVFPAHEDQIAIRIEFFDDEVEGLSYFDPLTGQRLSVAERIVIYPASHYVTPEEVLQLAVDEIRVDLMTRLDEFKANGQLVEAQRIKERTLYDIELIEETGRCAGIENYSRYLSRRAPGQQPPTLLEYFPDDWLLVVDESHVTIPQVRGMFKGDRSRKETLVRFGFRLPSALDNRPLMFDEFLQMVNQVIFISATPAAFELEMAEGVIVEQIIRPTGLLDPPIAVHPVENQVDDLFLQIQQEVERGNRVLVTTLTKRMSQELCNYYQELDLRVRYLHSDIETLDRVEILQGLRRGDFDVLIGINLLREGLDLPEVGLVAILDADKEGFLRNRTSLIQTIGRAARNRDGRVILYASKITKSMQAAIDETERRRSIQQAYNLQNGIVPQSISKSFHNPLATLISAPREETKIKPNVSVLDIPQRLVDLKKQMALAAKELDFERAILVREEIKQLEELHLRL